MLHRKRLLSILLALVLCMGLSLQVQAASINEAKEKANELEKKKDAAEAEKASLTEELNKVLGEMKELEKDINAKAEEVTKKEDELIRAKVDENTQYESMKKRIQYMYENGNTEFIEILCASKSIGEFLSNAEYITTMSEYDREQLNVFQDVVKNVEAQEKVLKKEYEELSDIREDLGEKQESVETLLEENDIKLADLDLQIGENQEELDKLLEEARKSQEIAQQSGGSYTPGSSGIVASGSGFFTHPCPGMTYQSSYFGEVRSFDPTPHNGNDYAAPRGTPTYAGAAGRVLIAGWSDSAGNWVVIDHGNGLVTKYMHHDSVCVSAGQYVERGQQIGYVGTTGYSTGNHLHFQVELNGVPVNPNDYM